MSRDLLDLASEIMKSRAPAPRQQQRQVQAQPVRTYAPPPAPAHAGGFLKSLGEGGAVFDFGHLTGNPVADNATFLLNKFGDPVQMATAVSQRAQITKAFSDYSNMGQDRYEAQSNASEAIQRGVHSEWDQQFDKSLDQQVVEMVKRDGVGSIPGQAPGQPGAGTMGAFNKSTMIVGSEEVVGQSETDAAVIEMMKASGADLSDDFELSEG